MIRILLVALGIAVVACMGTGLVAYHYKVTGQEAVSAKKAAERSLSTALDVNTDNEKTMTALANARARENQLAADLAAEVDQANQTALTIAKALADLRSQNADVDAYLKLPVPAPLRGLYDHAAAGGR